MGRSLAWVLVVLVAACTKPAPSPTTPPPHPDAAAAVVQLENYRADACACTDVQCTLKVAGERATWLAAEHGRYTFTAEQRTAADAANAGYAACNAPRENDGDRALRELRGIEAEMCACKDKACADAVTEKMMKMSEGYKDTKATEAQTKEATAIGERLMKCMMPLMTPPQP